MGRLGALEVGFRRSPRHVKVHYLIVAGEPRFGPAPEALLLIQVSLFPIITLSKYNKRLARKLLSRLSFVHTVLMHVSYGRWKNGEFIALNLSSLFWYPLCHILKAFRA